MANENLDLEENQHSSNAISQMANESLDLQVPTTMHSQPIEEVEEISLALLVPTVGQSGNNSTDGRQPQPPSIDNFIESISRPLPQPLLGVHNPAPMLHQIPLVTPPPSSSKRQSSRLAKKAANNVGKGAIQIAQELLVKKLGDLSGMEKDPINDEFEFYALHFERPMEKNTMEAI